LNWCITSSKSVGAAATTKVTMDFKLKNIQGYLETRISLIFDCLKSKIKVFGKFFKKISGEGVSWFGER